MRTLILDTCLAACQAAVVDDGRILAGLTEPMARGHQERLAPMVRETMAAAGAGFDSLDRIAVTVGPGSFTGLRVGLAFAKGLGLALDKPCVGVGTLEALAASAGGARRRAAAIDAARGGVHLQAFEDGRALGGPQNLPLEAVAARLTGLGGVEIVVGPQAHRLAPLLGVGESIDLAVPSLAALAHLAETTTEPARPLYLRAPDATVPAR